MILVRSDDPTPHLCTKRENSWIAQLQLQMICPENYKEVQKNYTKREN